MKKNTKQRNNKETKKFNIFPTRRKLKIYKHFQ